MRSYSHLYEQFVNHDNYILAVKNATRGKSEHKRRKAVMRYIRQHADSMEPDIVQYAIHFRTEEHKPKYIYDGIRRKRRKILVPTPRELIVHHMIVNVLKPIILRPMYAHSYGSLPYRGPAKGKRKATRGGKNAIEKFIRLHPGQCKYCLKMDIKKFFESVPHAILKDKFAKIIKDVRFLDVLNEVIDGPGGDLGMPIGFYTSQWFANFYLTGLDHYIKEQLHAAAYYRYMDDMVVFSASKLQLHHIRKEVQKYLTNKLGLELNHKWQIFPLCEANGHEQHSRALDFMGYRFYTRHTSLRRSLMLRATRNARRIHRKHRPTVYDYRQALAYKGWIRTSDSRKLYNKHIRPYISYGKAQKYLSQRAKGAASNVVQDQ